VCFFVFRNKINGNSHLKNKMLAVKVRGCLLFYKKKRCEKHKNNGLFTRPCFSMINTRLRVIDACYKAH
ncbi:MAG: hypothetical protein AAGJ35_04005, partial [Myxococcota bacterium]